jgi:hypothetical protein
MPRKSKTPKPPLPRLSYSIDEWSAAHGVARSTAYLLMKRGELRYFYLGKVRRIPADPSEALVAGGRP